MKKVLAIFILLCLGWILVACQTETPHEEEPMDNSSLIAKLSEEIKGIFD